MECEAWPRPDVDKEMLLGMEKGGATEVSKGAAFLGAAPPGRITSFRPVLPALARARGPVIAAAAGKTERPACEWPQSSGRACCHALLCRTAH